MSSPSELAVVGVFATVTSADAASLAEVSVVVPLVPEAAAAVEFPALVAVVEPLLPLKTFISTPAQKTRIECLLTDYGDASCQRPR